MALSFANKVALVTGAAGGLGKAISEAFLKAGARVIMIDIDERRLKATQNELSASGQLHIIKANITQEKDVKWIFDDTIMQFERVDILVNNAGVMDHFDAVGTCEKDIWDRVIAVNLTAPYLMSKYAVNHFEKSTPPGGVILNVGSTAGLFGARAGVAYTSSKHGLVGLTKNTAAFYAKKGIRCNAILPGGMSTGIMGDMFQTGQVNMENFKIMGTTAAMEPGTSDLSDVASAALYLCSDGAKPINGALLTLDNGWAAY